MAFPRNDAGGAECPIHPTAEGRFGVVSRIGSAPRVEDHRRSCDAHRADGGLPGPRLAHPARPAGLVRDHPTLAKAATNLTLRVKTITAFGKHRRLRWGAASGCASDQVGLLLVEAPGRPCAFLHHAG